MITVPQWSWRVLGLFCQCRNIGLSRFIFGLSGEYFSLSSPCLHMRRLKDAKQPLRALTVVSLAESAPVSRSVPSLIFPSGLLPLSALDRRTAAGVCVVILSTLFAFEIMPLCSSGDLSCRLLGPGQNWVKQRIFEFCGMTAIILRRRVTFRARAICRRYPHN